MDFLEPDLQKTYDKCKYIVKVWEYKFQKKYKRIPSKLDIREAPSEVRNAYKKYFQLKSVILEQSFKDVEGFEDLGEEDGENKVHFNTQIASGSDENCAIPIINESLPIPVNNEKVEEADLTWGPHLNNRKDEERPQEKDNQPKLNLNISKKLFCGSKFLKRNPRKSLSFSQKNKSDSQPTTSFASFSSEEAINFLQNDVLDKPFKIVTHYEGSLSQPLNAVQSYVEFNQRRSLKIVDQQWLNRVAQITGTSSENSELILSQHVEDNLTESTKLDYDSEDIIDNSDEEDSFQFRQSLHVAKKRKIERLSISLPSNEIKPTDTHVIVEINSKIKCVKESNLETTKIIYADNEEQTKLSKTEALESISKPITKKNKNSIKKTITENLDDQISEEQSTNTELKKTKRTKRISKSINKSSNLKTPKKETNISASQEISPRRSIRKTKVKSSFKEFSSSEEEAFQTDTDDKDPEFLLEKGKKLDENNSDEENKSKKYTKKNITSKITSNTKRGRRKVVENTQTEEENDTYDLEFSVKPRIVASRYGNIKNLIANHKKERVKKSDAMEPSRFEEKDGIKDKRQQAREKLEEKISSGNLNENFVKININKKVFVRGKKGRNFSKYKKAQWKKAKALAGPDMYMGGCDGGMLTCFNCGQIGHFAQNCKATKGDALLTLNPEEDEEQCPFPTLEEAAKMANEGNLNIRIPKIILNDTHKTDQEISDNKDPFTDQIDSEELLLEALKLEEHVKKLDIQKYIDNVKVVEPYYELNEGGAVIETPLEVFEVLKKFGHSSFRLGQERAIMRILSGKSTLVTLSTGSGKSLCYQLPAFMFSQREPCISLVISPLVSLMDDQVTSIAKFLKAACLHSNQTTQQRNKILEAISLGELSILLVSPEAIVAGEKQKGFSSFLRKLPPIAFACIDEAHCVSQWSHNFRPSYLMICRVLRESLGVKTILGLTATATKATQSSIIEQLQIPDGEQGIVSDIPLPDNLQLSVSKDPNRDHALLSLLLSERFKDCNSIIIYCTRRQECERIAGFLRTSLKSEQPLPDTNKKRKRLNLQAEPYHAGMSASRRRTIQNAFMSGQLKIVVATIAFGMGINKSDIRAVIHYNMPSSFESYVQEVGRAGRDGLKSQCHVFLHFKGGDENELRRHIHSNSIDRYIIRKLLEKIFIPCSCKGVCPKHEVAFSVEETVLALDIPEENISTLLCYLELHKNKYIELLSPAYIKCKVISYGGPLRIRKVSKECPPLAMAIALQNNKEGNGANVFEFPIIDVAAAMGWESGICKHKLKNLEWTTVDNQPKRSAISVKFFDLGFRILAPGNLTDDQLDEALDSLHNQVVEQEKTALLQLNAIHHILWKVAKPSFQSSLLDETDQLIKSKVREYFNSPDPLKLVPEINYPQYNEAQLVNDIKGIISMYRDNNFTGRAIARIFQGIQSPNYPAAIWGRCKFWRSHLDVDFHVIVKTATREIIRLR